MPFPRSLLARLFRRSRVEEEISEELQFHIASRASDIERSGSSPRRRNGARVWSSAGWRPIKKTAAKPWAYA